VHRLRRQLPLRRLLLFRRLLRVLPLGLWRLVVLLRLRLLLLPVLGRRRLLFLFQQGVAAAGSGSCNTGTCNLELQQGS
jgi:hypothetical protein